MDLDTYRKKQFVPTAPQFVEEKPQKIKLSLEEAELKYYEFEEVNGIKIYSGLETEKKLIMKRNMRLLRKVTYYDKFTRLVPSVLSVQGAFRNISFNEEKCFPITVIPPEEYSSIIKIGCNFGEIYVFPNKYEQPSIKEMLTSIVALQGKNIIIGCNCQEPLNTSLVYEKWIGLKKDELFHEVFNRITPTSIEEQNISKSKIAKILKLFANLFDFKLVEKSEILQLYTFKIAEPNDLRIIHSHIDKIVEINDIFNQYMLNCKCTDQSILSSIPSKERIIDKESKRKRQGTGLYFSSQVTFEIYNPTNKKISKIKLFRNGNFQVPGVKKPNMSDLIEPIMVLKNFWNWHQNKICPEEKACAEISYFLSNMRNYKCHLADKNNTIILNQLEAVLRQEKEMPLLDCDSKFYETILNNLEFSKATCCEIFMYNNKSLFSIAEINNNCERYPGLLVKFNRPIPIKKNKKLTIKILGSGKINFDGGNSELEIFELYYWLQHIFSKYWNQVIYNQSNDSDVEISDCSMESLYDSE